MMCISSSVKEIGYWCPSWFELYQYNSDLAEDHLENCEGTSPTLKNPKRLLKKKFRGFCKSFNVCYDKATAQSNRLKKLNFFDSGSIVYLENVKDAVEKIYDNSCNKFLKVKNLQVITKKINSIFKEICNKAQDYSYIFTMVLKAKELINNYKEIIRK